IYVPDGYQADEYRGIVRGSQTRGEYLSLNHLQALYSNGVGFSFGRPNSTFNDSTAIGCGREGFYFVGYAPSGEMAAGCKAFRCLATYCACGEAPTGQAFTTGAPRTWWVSCGAFFNGMCGFDFL